MPALKLQQFGGQLPAWDDTLIPDGQAAYSRDVYSYSGALIGWRKPKLLHTLLSSTTRFAFRVPTIVSGTATAYLVFQLNVNEGDTVKIGTEVYTFTATVTNAFDVLLGATANDSATNLYKALTLTGTMGVTYGTGTCLIADISSTPIQGTHDFGGGPLDYIQVEAPEAGAAFNSTPVTESTSNVRTTWLYDLVLLAHTTTTLLGGINPAHDTTISGTATWLEFDDKETDVMRSQVFNDRFNRFYFASPSQPPKYNTYDRILASSPHWLLGIPTPGCTPLLTVSGGSNLDTLGETVSSTSNTDAPGANTLFLVKVTPSGATQINDVACIPVATSGTALMKGVIYSDDAGVPDRLLNIGSEVVGTDAGVQVTSAFTIPQPVLSGVAYWIGFTTDTSVALTQADDAAQGVKASVGYGTPPDPAPTMTTGQASWLIWADIDSGAILGTRAYVYTWVSAYGEEGPPSPPVLATAWSNSTWELGLFQPPADDQGVVRNLTKMRIYRTLTGATGVTTYFFVAEVDITTATYTDTITDDIVSGNDQLQSTLWSAPPENLQGIMAMPNGMSVGFRNNEIWFSEPYRPHAWPPNYVLTTEYPIVGLGVAANAVVACTEGYPMIATGINPASMAVTKLKLNEPCLSRGSILSADQGIYYQSRKGLIFVSISGAALNATESWITPDKWAQLVPLKNVHAIRVASSYFAFGTREGLDVDVARQGFTVELAPDTQNFTMWPQPGGHRIGFNLLSAPRDLDMDNLMIDPWTGNALTIQAGAVYWYDFSDQAPEAMTYRWKSKKYQQKAKKNLSAFRVWFTLDPGTPAQSSMRNTDVVQNWQPGQYLIVRVYADDVLVTTREVRTSGEILRIVSGFKAEFWQFEFEGIARVSNMQVAPSVKELRDV